MPSLIITPDMSAETWLGAAGCASGSQTCSGTPPAFAPKPSASSAHASERAPAPSAGAAAVQSANRALPVHAVSSSMPASMQASPACVITAYTQPACADAAGSRPARAPSSTRT